MYEVTIYSRQAYPSEKFRIVYKWIVWHHLNNDLEYVIRFVTVWTDKVS